MSQKALSQENRKELQSFIAQGKGEQEVILLKRGLADAGLPSLSGITRNLTRLGNRADQTSSDCLGFGFLAQAASSGLLTEASKVLEPPQSKFNQRHCLS